MGDAKTYGTIGRLYKQKIFDKAGKPVLDDKGVQKEGIRIYFTQDAIVKQGQLAFCDYIEDSYKELEAKGFLKDTTAAEAIAKIRADDEDANRTTLCRVSLGKVKPTNEGNTL